MDNFNKTDDLYDPNFSIDSNNTEKLDMYGVWLKKKKNTVGSLDSGDSQTVTGSSTEDQGGLNFDDDFSFADMDTDSEIAELDELDDAPDSVAVPLETPELSSTDTYTSNDVLDEDSFESLDLDDFLSDDSPVEETQQETSDTFVEEEPIALDFDEMTDDTAQPAHTEESPAGLENFSEISLADFEDEPQAQSSGSDEDFEPVDDFDDILKDEPKEAKAEHSERKDANALDIDVVADDEQAKAQPLSELSSHVVEDNSDISIFGSDDDNADSAHSDTEETEDVTFFDDVEAVTQDLLAPQQPPEALNKSKPQETVPEQETKEPVKDIKETMGATAAIPQRSAAEQDKATELLMQIAHEISDLKAELNSLKAGMTAQSKAISEGLAKDAPAHTENTAADAENCGFFSDDDTDETIALTGDELNNILITADFTEEQNSEEGERSAAEALQDAEITEDYEIPPVLTKDIDPELQESPPVDRSFEESIAEPTFADADSDYKPEAGGEELLASSPAFNVEVAPITSISEDLSYLDDQSEVTDADMDFIEGSADAQLETTELDTIEDAEPIDDEADFDDINIESFDIPSEQEIEVPAQDREPMSHEASSAEEMTGERTIHELQSDKDFPNPFADEATAAAAKIKEEIIEEPFIAEVPSLEPEVTETQSEAAEPIEELNALSEDTIPELEKEVDNESAPVSIKQETLLQAASKKRETISIPLELKNEIKSVLAYMDQLLEALPEKKIEEFAKSEYFETYKHLFEELGIS